MIILNGRLISKKRNYRRGRGGGLYLSKTYKDWQENALWQLKQYKERWTGPVHIEYQFELKGKIDFDIDNAICSANDLLEDAGIISNDKNIVSSTAVKHHGFKDFRTLVKIKSLKKGVKKR